MNPDFTDGISRFAYRVFLPLLRDSRENMNFSGPAEGDFPVHAERSLYQYRIEHHFGGGPGTAEAVPAGLGGSHPLNNVFRNVTIRL